MPIYNWKHLPKVPSGNEFVDIVLSRTQRRTPTVIHPGYKISRIRTFYIRKVRYTQQTISERLGDIVSKFPRIDNIHPFFQDLLNVLYDRDHYKLALGQLNVAKKLVENVGRNYVKLIKYGESLYRCKMLKRAALGRMATILKKQKASFAYLEEVRKHMSRLPSIEPDTRTLIVCGYPNVGKSSFMNKVTRANVDVQPYAFTTKSLYVGHMDYRYVPWQVIDTPGILDHPLEQRNTIEMQAITALAHLHCCVLYFIDISEECHYTIDQQINLFESIKPLFSNKELLIVINKIDIIKFNELPIEVQERINNLVDDPEVQILEMSNKSEIGISTVKQRACDLLLLARHQRTIGGKKIDDVMNRITVVMPKPRDNKKREVFIPDSVINQRNELKNILNQTNNNNNNNNKNDDNIKIDNNINKNIKVIDDDYDEDLLNKIKELETEIKEKSDWKPTYNGQYEEYYRLEDDNWKFDKMPAIMDGKNIYDYIDEDIFNKLELLEEEEAQREAKKALENDNDSDLDDEEKALFTAIREKKIILRKTQKLRGIERKVEKKQLIGTGKRKRNQKNNEDDNDIDNNIYENERDEYDYDNNNDMKIESINNNDNNKSIQKRKKRKILHSKRTDKKYILYNDKVPRNQRGLKDEKDKKQAEKLLRKHQRHMTKGSKISSSDRTQEVSLLKHLIAGKMGLGTSRSR